MDAREQFRRLAEAKGRPLQGLGIDETALRLDDALKAVAVLREGGVPVLGGDVYQLVNNWPQMTKENWFCDQEPGESLERFVERSGQAAEGYLNTYRGKGPDFLFTIVVRE